MRFILHFYCNDKHVDSIENDSAPPLFTIPEFIEFGKLCFGTIFRVYKKRNNVQMQMVDNKIIYIPDVYYDFSHISLQ